MNEEQIITVETPTSVEQTETKKRKGKGKIIAAISAVLAVVLISVVAVVLLVPGAATKEVTAQIDAVEAIAEENYKESLDVLAAYNNLSALEQRKVKNYAALDEKFQTYFTSIVNKIESNCTTMTKDSYDILLNCQSLYESLSNEHKAFITNIDAIEEALPAARTEKISGVVADILASQNANYIYTTTMEYEEELTEDQYLDCMINFAKWYIYSESEKTLKNKLKDPGSYQRYSGTVTTIEIADDKRSGTFIVDISYSATNSYGGRIKDAYTNVASFKIPTTGGVAFSDLY
ncbi:MAG: hypothetical protein E7523_11865 [Ruminococcaceae bacterium]|nr:hypothetical protein [Oscillospiraceae bacterium]